MFEVGKAKMLDIIHDHPPYFKSSEWNNYGKIYIRQSAIVLILEI